MKSPLLCLAALVLCLNHSASVFAGPLDILKSAISSTNAAQTAAANLPEDQIIGGLKEALGKGVENAIASLGRADGFLTNVNVKIQMPAKLQSVEKGLRLAGQGKLVDDFIASMNRAAEQAVPVAAPVFGDAIRQMSITDARSVLSSTNDAATQFFRRTTQTNLYAKFHPLVQKATDAVGVTARYKQMMSKFTSSDSFSGFLGSKTVGKFEAADLDAYVTDKALDGLFKMIAAEEKNIRANPVARTTDLLQKVFGTGK